MTDEEEQILQWFYHLPCKVGKRVHGWLCHKSRLHHASKRLSKLEQYVYLPHRFLVPLLNFLQTDLFTWIGTGNERAYPTIFNVLKALEGKEQNGKGKPPEPFGEHFYKTHFSRVMLHRHQPYLVRVYECTSMPNGAVKLEIAYLDESKRNSRRLVGLANPHFKLRAMREFKRRINKRFPIQPEWIYEDHSEGQPIGKFVHWLLRQSKQKTPGVHKRLFNYIQKNGGMENITDLF